MNHDIHVFTSVDKYNKERLMKKLIICPNCRHDHAEDKKIWNKGTILRKMYVTTYSCNKCDGDIIARISYPNKTGEADNIVKFLKGENK